MNRYVLFEGHKISVSYDLDLRKGEVLRTGNSFNRDALVHSLQPNFTLTQSNIFLHKFHQEGEKVVYHNDVEKYVLHHL